LAWPVLGVAERQGWPAALNIALLASLPLAIYGFNADQVLLLPSVLQMIAWLWRGEVRRPGAWVVGGALLLIYSAWFGMLFVDALHVHWFAFAPLALAALYAVACRHRTAASGLPAAGRLDR
jgi:hypothetical protein